MLDQMANGVQAKFLVTHYSEFKFQLGNYMF